MSVSSDQARRIARRRRSGERCGSVLQVRVQLGGPARGDRAPGALLAQRKRAEPCDGVEGRRCCKRDGSHQRAAYARTEIVQRLNR